MVKRTPKKIIIAFAVCIAVFFAFETGCSPSGQNEKIPFFVKNGETATSIAVRLKSDKLIASEKMFILYVKITKSANKIKAGYYEFSRKDGMFKILRYLKDGSKSFTKITIPEGSNIRQTAEIIASKGMINKERFIEIASEKKLEGYLMPETYFFDPMMKEEDIIAAMKKEFDNKVTPDMYERAKELGMTMEQIITMASIIEKEAVNPDERTTIAAVFYNRINKKIRLESCATVLYAMGVNKARLTVEDTKFDSPYNTYRHAGLPPGPICSPGIESIRAALYPANTGSLFFVSQGNGSHLFAENLDEHVKNKQQTKKIIKKRQQEAKTQAAQGKDANN